MIDHESEQLIRLSAVPPLVPGPRITRQAVHEWVTRGLRGGTILLETILLPSGRFTSREAVARFLTRVQEYGPPRCGRPRKRKVEKVSV